MTLKSLKIFYITFWITFIISFIFNFDINGIYNLVFSSFCSAIISVIITYLRFKIIEGKKIMKKKEILKCLHDVMLDYSSDDYYKEALILAMNFIDKNMKEEE